MEVTTQILGKAAKVLGSAAKVRGKTAKVLGSDPKALGNAAKLWGSVAKPLAETAKLLLTVAQIIGSVAQVVRKIVQSVCRTPQNGEQGELRKWLDLLSSPGFKVKFQANPGRSNYAGCDSIQQKLYFIEINLYRGNRSPVTAFLNLFGVI